MSEVDWKYVKKADVAATNSYHQNIQHSILIRSRLSEVNIRQVGFLAHPNPFLFCDTVCSSKALLSKITDVSNEVWNAENVAFCIKNRSSPTHNLGATITTYVKSLGNHLPESSHLTSFKHKRHKCSAVARLKRLRINNVDGRHTSAWKIKSRKSANHRKGRNVFSSCGSGKSATDTTNFQEGGVVCSSLRKEEQTPLKFLFKKENTEFRHANFSRKVSSRCENLSKARMQHDPIFVNDEKVNKVIGEEQISAL